MHDQRWLHAADEEAHSRTLKERPRRLKTGEDDYHTVTGAYREVDAPNRLVYTWSWEEQGPDAFQSVVTVTFTPLGDSTEVVVAHDLFPDEKTTADH
ncbi:MAG: hypothetical protein HKN13_11195, partial [Rhodothermales bacterium]|nr:hypothetical protein [Rhodothermales bacterium]